MLELLVKRTWIRACSTTCAAEFETHPAGTARRRHAPSVRSDRPELDADRWIRRSLGGQPMALSSGPISSRLPQALREAGRDRDPGDPGALPAQLPVRPEPQHEVPAVHRGRKSSARRACPRTWPGWPWWRASSRRRSYLAAGAGGMWQFMRARGAPVRPARRQLRGRAVQLGEIDPRGHRVSDRPERALRRRVAPGGLGLQHGRGRNGALRGGQPGRDGPDPPPRAAARVQRHEARRPRSSIPSCWRPSIVAKNPAKYGFTVRAPGAGHHHAGPHTGARLLLAGRRSTRPAGFPKGPCAG
jgi:hypothetical protein